MMLATLEVLIILAGVVFISILVSSIFGRRGEWTASFQSVAQRYGGWYSPAGFFRRPAATFAYKESTCHVRCRVRRHTGRGSETEFRIQWPVKHVNLEVIQDLGSSRSRRLRRSARNFTTIDQQFDQRFDIYTTNVESAAKVLSSGVRWQIEQLADFLGDSSVYVGITKGWLFVAKRGFIKSGERLDDFVRFSLELYDQLMLTLNDEIAFTDDHMVSAVEVMQCPVCSNDIVGHMVICVRCKTPHCLDCWQYNGTCGMFACGETRFMSIGTAPASKQDG